MTEEHMSLADGSDLSVEQLLWRQDVLQAEAQFVLRELDLLTLLSAGGKVRQMGSSASGLMVWRDLDLSVYSPGLSLERMYTIMQPLLTHPRIQRVRYLNESGAFNTTGVSRNERYYFGLYYLPLEGSEWKVDVSFWLDHAVRVEPIQDALEQILSQEMRLIILQIKNAWYRLPTYRSQVYSVDIYDAVLEHGVRTLDDFDRYLVERGKPARR